MYLHCYFDFQHFYSLFSKNTDLADSCPSKAEKNVQKSGIKYTKKYSMHGN